MRSRERLQPAIAARTKSESRDGQIANVQKSIRAKWCLELVIEKRAGCDIARVSPAVQQESAQIAKFDSIKSNSIASSRDPIA